MRIRDIFHKGNGSSLSPSVGKNPVSNAGERMGEAVENIGDKLKEGFGFMK